VSGVNDNFWYEFLDLRVSSVKLGQPRNSYQKSSLTPDTTNQNIINPIENYYEFSLNPNFPPKIWKIMH
jgi:hypothetical protein